MLWHSQQQVACQALQGYQAEQSAVDASALRWTVCLHQSMAA